MSHYIITTTDGRQHRALRAEYATQDEAAEALRGVMGWAEIHLSDRFAVGSSSRDGMAVSAYETAGECDADETGAYAARITEIVEAAS